MNKATDGKGYVVLCVSVYPGDVRRIERLVEATKGADIGRTSKSAVIRDALQFYYDFIFEHER